MTHWGLFHHIPGRGMWTWMVLGVWEDVPKLCCQMAHGRKIKHYLHFLLDDYPLAWFESLPFSPLTSEYFHFLDLLVNVEKNYAINMLNGALCQPEQIKSESRKSRMASVLVIFHLYYFSIMQTISLKDQKALGRQRRELVLIKKYPLHLCVKDLGSSAHRNQLLTEDRRKEQGNWGAALTRMLLQYHVVS